MDIASDTAVVIVIQLTWGLFNQLQLQGCESCVIQALVAIFHYESLSTELDA